MVWFSLVEPLLSPLNLDFGLVKVGFFLSVIFEGRAGS